MANAYVTATQNDTIIKLTDNQQFGNKNIIGMQHKGMVTIDGCDKYVKLDTLNPNIPGEWENSFDYKYSSISESLVSCLVGNMVQDDVFDSVIYEYGKFELNNDITTGTTSDNYLGEYDIEYILSTSKISNRYIAIGINDYIDRVADNKVANRIPELVKIASKYNIDELTAKQFFIQQAGFDILTGNTDRLNNPSNIVIAYDTDTEKGRLVNMDYGRCLQINTWTETTETNYELYDEWYDDDINDFTNNMLSNNDSILSPYSHEKAIEYLYENGYNPLKINMDGLKYDLQNLKTKIENSNIPCQKFAIMKLEAFKALLESDKIRDLWEDVSLPLTFDGLEGEITI